MQRQEYITKLKINLFQTSPKSQDATSFLVMSRGNGIQSRHNV